MPIGRVKLAEFGRFVSGKYRFLKCTDFAAKTRCADFEAYPRTVIFVDPLLALEKKRGGRMFFQGGFGGVQGNFSMLWFYIEILSSFI